MLAKEFSMDVLPHVIDMAMVQFLPFIRSYQGVRNIQNLNLPPQKGN